MAKTDHIPQREIYDLPDFPSRRTIPYLVQYLARLMAVDFQTRVAATGVAPAQAYVLRELWRAEPLSQVEISQRLDIGKATVGQSLKRLERAGFIERKRSAEDGRVITVHLTEKGRWRVTRWPRPPPSKCRTLTRCWAPMPPAPWNPCWKLCLMSTAAA